MEPRAVRALIEQFSKFPAVGPRGAARFVFYLLKAPKHEVDQLVSSIENLRARVRLCSFCFNPHDGTADLCGVCSDPRRDKSLLCVVEKESDLAAVEKTRQYKGLYFILGGTVGALRRSDLERIRVQELKERLAKRRFEEVILALNPTSEGEATMLYLERQVKSLKAKTTRLARGLPAGGEMEYADEETLSSALLGRA